MTLTTPAVAGTNTITLPAATGTVGLDGPAFSAYASGVTNTANNTNTKIVLAAEAFDTANCFDTSASRFTPNVAGYYQINGCVNCGGLYAYTQAFIYKNGTSHKAGMSNGGYSNYAGGSVSVSSVVYLNGTTDYIELYWVQSAGFTVNSGSGESSTYFNGALVRGA